MYNPTPWQRFKDIVRYIFCKHKHVEVRTVKGYSEGEEPRVLGRFVYCLDCRNNVSGFVGEREAHEQEF